MPDERRAVGRKAEEESKKGGRGTEEVRAVAFPRIYGN